MTAEAGENANSELTSLDKRYVSPDLQGKSQKVAETLTNTTEDLRRKYMETNEVSYEQAAEAVKEVKAFKGDMTDNAKKSYSKLKKGLNYLNTLSGKRVNLVVTEAHDSFNGSLLDDTIYIGADTFESDTWAETLVHEYTHFAEGTKEYQELMDALTGDSKLVEKTLSDIFEKAGYGFDKDKTSELLNRYERLQNSKNKTPNIDSNEEIRYNRKNDFVEGDVLNEKEGAEQNSGRERDGESRQRSTIRSSSGRGSVSIASNDEGVRGISEINGISKRRAEDIKASVGDIYSSPKGEIQEILSWHAEKENIDLYFVKPYDKDNKFYDFYNDILYIYETATEKEFVDILNIVKPIKRNVDYNKVAHISKERWDKFLEWRPDAYITRIPIQQFLDMTTDSYVTQRQINAFSSKISEKVDVNDIKNTSGEYIYLEIDLESGSVVGHEGRHRMTALLNNGNGYADVFVIFTTETGKELYRHLEINGQYNNQTYFVSLVKADSKQFGSLINKIKNIDDGNIRYNLKSTQNESETKRDTSSVNDTVDNEVVEELTEDELKYIRLYKSELGAHLSANMLGTESFIDKLVRENTTIAEKILNKLSDLKQMFERLGDAEARAEYKKIKKAEKLYLGAVEKAGYAYVGRKIVGAINEREEETKYSIKYPRFSENDISTNINSIAEMDAVATIDDSKLERTGKTPKEIFNEYFDSLGNNIASETFGDIALSKSSVKSEIRHGITSEKIASIEAIPAVIENGRVIFSKTKEGTDVERIVVAAPIRIGTIDYYMGVMLQRDIQNQRLYLHNVAAVKAEETVLPSQDDSLTNWSDESNSRLFITSILQNAINVKVNKQKFADKSVENTREVRFNLKSNGKITKSRGEYQKLKANYTKKKKYDKKDVTKAVLDVPYVSTLPKATQKDVIESMWCSLNTIEGDNQKDRFIELCYNRILRDLWQESKSFAELSTDEIREIEQKLYKTVRNIAKIGGSPSYLSKVEAQYAKTEAGRWRKKFLEAEEWNKIVGLLMHLKNT